MLGQIAIPLMLFSLGVRLANVDFKEWKIGILFALLTPIVGFCIAFMIIQFYDFTTVQAGSLLLFGALPPAVMNFLFAERFNQSFSVFLLFLYRALIFSIFPSKFTSCFKLKS